MLYMKEKHNQHSSVKCYDNYSYYLDITNPLITPMIFIFYLVVKRLVITKNSVVKTQNLLMNHKSRPVKSNPDICIYIYINTQTHTLFWKRPLWDTYLNVFWKNCSTSAALLKMNQFTSRFKRFDWLHLCLPFLMQNNLKYSKASFLRHHKPSIFVSITPHWPHSYHSVTFFWILHAC